MRISALVSLVLLLLVTGCATPDVPDRGTGAAGAGPVMAGAGADAPAQAEVQTIRIAAVGDSITVGGSPDFAGGDIGELSWVSHAVGGAVELAGGWARGGATTAEMVENVTPVDADVVVILAGTNDVWKGLTVDGHEPSLANIREIVRTVGAEEVVLSAIPPLDRKPAQAEAFNVSLEALAAEAGWHWVDAPAELRDGSRFAPGMASDGIHPTLEGAELLGEALRAAVLDTAT